MGMTGTDDILNHDLFEGDPMDFETSLEASLAIPMPEGSDRDLDEWFLAVLQADNFSSA